MAQEETNNMLYHYTSVETLYKIFHNQENGYIKLRANLFMNMNDPLDCRYFIKEVRHILSEGNKHISEDEEKNIEKSMQNVGLPYFISFTKLKDSLPMWYMYGDKGHGVAIGFSKKLLKSAVGKFQTIGSKKNRIKNKNCFCRLCECKYWSTSEIKKDFVDKYNICFDENGEITSICEDDVCSLSYLIKHPSYKHEKESRIVFLDSSKSNELTYKELCIPLEAVEEIICGPCGDESFVRAILPPNYRDKVKSSEINYTDTPPQHQI